MARNGSGSYSLPATVNPVVDGTAITITWANTTLDDIATALTASLDRSGNGGMLAPLKSADGTVAAPGLTFGTDTDTGFYRIGANNVGLAIGGAKVLDITSTRVAVTGVASASQQVWAPDGARETPGYAFTAEQGSGLYRSGAGDVRFSVLDTDVLKMTTTGLDVSGTLTGNAGSTGVTCANGTAATGAAPTNALVLSNGHLAMTAVVDPNKTVAINKTLVPGLIPRAWAVCNVDAAGVATVVDGFNVASAAISGGGTFVLTLAHALADTNYAPLATAIGTVSWSPQTMANSTTEVYVRAYEMSGAGAAITWTDGTARKFAVVVFGRQ